MKDELEIINKPSDKLAEVSEQNRVSLFKGTFNGIMTLPIQVKTLFIDVKLPKYNKEGDSGFDLVAREDVFILPGENALISTGVVFDIPLGFEIQIRPRSGLNLKTKFRVLFGTIDSNYRGEIKVICENNNTYQFTIVPPIQSYDSSAEFVKNFTIGFKEDYAAKTLENNIEAVGRLLPTGTLIIRKGDRVAQGVIARVAKGQFTLADELSETNRGTDGFGASGIRVNMENSVMQQIEIINQKWMCFCRENGVTVALSESDSCNTIMTSVDEIRWTPRISIDKKWREITHIENMFMISTPFDNNIRMISPDGINWTTTTIG
jgi:dUTP pyrophosphatase